MSDTVEKLKQHLEAADKQIGWLKGDKTRLNKSIKIRERAMDSLMAMEEKVSKQLAEAEQDSEKWRKLCGQLVAQQKSRTDFLFSLPGYSDGGLEGVRKHIAEAEQREEALRKYVQHLPDCNLNSPVVQVKNGKRLCTCGLEAALKEKD